MRINDHAHLVAPLYSDIKFIVMLESHLTYIANQPTTRILPVNTHRGIKYLGAFYDLLNDMNVNPEYHYITMRINGYTNSASYRGDRSMILVPDSTTIETLASVFLASV